MSVDTLPRYFCDLNCHHAAPSIYGTERCHSPLNGVSMGAFLFILLFGEKNEPRRTAARYRAFSLGRRHLARGLRNSLRSHTPRPLSALGCRPPGPIRAVSLFPSLCVFACFSFVPFSHEGGTVILRSTGLSIGAFLFILLFGEKNEPRRTAARYRAFSLGRRRLARGCGTRCAHTVLALFPPSAAALPAR